MSDITDLLKPELERLQEIHPEVTGLSFGVREKDGRMDTAGDRVIIIGVDAKQRIYPWSKRKRLPSRILGKWTDIQVYNEEPCSVMDSTPMIKHYTDGTNPGPWIGGSIGPVLYHKSAGLVALTNRHVARHNPGGWTLDQNGVQTPGAVWTEFVASEHVDAAVLKVFKPRTLPASVSKGVAVAAPEVGMQVYYCGGMSGEVKRGTILQMGWGSIPDPDAPDGVYLTVNFRFLNLMGESAAPISGDSGSAVYTNINGVDAEGNTTSIPHCVGIIYAGGGRTEWAAAVPITNILDHWPELYWGEKSPAPQFKELEQAQVRIKQLELELHNAAKANSDCSELVVQMQAQVDEYKEKYHNILEKYKDYKGAIIRKFRELALEDKD